MPTVDEEQSHFRTAIDEYLETLPAQTCQRLYQSPASCLAVFRLLPTFAKQLVMSLLYVPTEVPVADIAARCFQEYASKFNESLQKLLRLHIIERVDEQTGDIMTGRLRMNTVFGRELRNALTGGGEHGTFGVPCDVPDKHPVDEAFLDNHATQQWEAILHFMIGTAVTKRPGRAALNLLRRSGLMASSDADSVSMAITNKGFQFLLQDVNTQLWAFLLQYLDMVQDLGMDLVEVLNFLFQLGTLELGKDYSVEPLTETQRRMLDDLQDYGLCYRRKKGSRRFYPTRLAITLASGNSTSLPSEQNDNGYIILETNYRVYAYTDSPLQIAVLSLFCTMRSRFQNMVCGAITRESIRAALTNGITSDQIPVLPLTVVDQIRLWEMEKNRLQTTQGFLYQQFARQQDFDTVLQYAQELVVTDDGHVQAQSTSNSAS
ncbi:transcription factor TFIIH subunit p52/Tfb2 [Syncephalis plumigaleata]|nr:transcription factor TFIIH subunit p52/Tfb2 [Syncephalis plumigaleata]